MKIDSLNYKLINNNNKFQIYKMKIGYYKIKIKCKQNYIYLQISLIFIQLIKNLNIKP